MKRIAWLVVCSALVLTSCAAASASSDIGVALDEFSIELSRDSYIDGPVQLTIENVGEFAHTLVVEQSGGTVVAATQVVAAGESAQLDIDLTGDNYRFTCRIVTSLEDGSVIDHFAEGMVATVRSGGAGSTD